MHARGCVVFLSCLLMVGGCAVDITKRSQQEELVKDRQPSEPMVLARDIQLSLPEGLSMCPLTQGSTWQRIGSIPQGQVYRAVSAVLLVKSGNAHEAYIVRAGNALIGVYLPVERVLIRADRPVSVKP